MTLFQWCFAAKLIIRDVIFQEIFWFQEIWEILPCTKNRKAHFSGNFKAFQEILIIVNHISVLYIYVLAQVSGCCPWWQIHCSHSFPILFKSNGCLVMDLTCPYVVNVACDHTICNSFSVAFHIRGIQRHCTFYAICTECNYMPCRCLFAKWYMQDDILQMPFCKERGDSSTETPLKA